MLQVYSCPTQSIPHGLRMQWRVEAGQLQGERGQLCSTCSALPPVLQAFVYVGKLWVELWQPSLQCINQSYPQLRWNSRLESDMHVACAHCSATVASTLPAQHSRHLHRHARGCCCCQRTPLMYELCEADALACKRWWLL